MEKIKNTSQVRQTRSSNLNLTTQRHKIKHTVFSHIFHCTRYYFFNDNGAKVSQYCIFNFLQKWCFFTVVADVLSLLRLPLALAKVLQNCSLFSPRPKISFWFKHFKLIGCHGNRNVKFTEKIFKNHLKSRKGDKAETLQNCLFSISFYKNCVFYCSCSSSLVVMAT